MRKRWVHCKIHENDKGVDLAAASRTPRLRQALHEEGIRLLSRKKKERKKIVLCALRDMDEEKGVALKCLGRDHPGVVRARRIVTARTDRPRRTPVSRRAFINEFSCLRRSVLTKLRHYIKRERKRGEGRRRI